MRTREETLALMTRQQTLSQGAELKRLADQLSRMEKAVQGLTQQNQALQRRIVLIERQLMVERG